MAGPIFSGSGEISAALRVNATSKGTAQAMQEFMNFKCERIWVIPGCRNNVGDPGILTQKGSRFDAGRKTRDPIQGAKERDIDRLRLATTFVVLLAVHP